MTHAHETADPATADPACAVAHGAPGTAAHGAEDPACAVAHGAPAPATRDRTLVAVFASPVAEFLLRYGADAGFRIVLVETEAERAKAASASGADIVAGADGLDESADVVVTDHHRPELGTALRDALAGRS